MPRYIKCFLILFGFPFSSRNILSHSLIQYFLFNSENLHEDCCCRFIRHSTRFHCCFCHFITIKLSNSKIFIFPLLFVSCWPCEKLSRKLPHCITQYRWSKIFLFCCCCYFVAERVNVGQRRWMNVFDVFGDFFVFYIKDIRI